MLHPTQITARDYLETALRPVSGSGPSVAAKNGIRSSIASLFPQRDCFTLVRLYMRFRFTLRVRPVRVCCGRTGPRLHRRHVAPQREPQL